MEFYIQRMPSTLTLTKGDPPSKLAAGVSSIASFLISDLMFAIVALSRSQSAFVVTGTVWAAWGGEENKINHAATLT